MLKCICNTVRSTQPGRLRAIHTSPCELRSLTSHHQWSLRTTHCTDPRYTKTILTDSLTGHTGPLTGYGGPFLDTPVHFWTRWSTHWTRWSTHWTRWSTHWTRWPISRHAGPLTGHAGRLVGHASPPTEHAGPFLDTLVHFWTSQSTHFIVLQSDWDPSLSADRLVPISSSKYMSVLCLVSMSSSTESRYWPSLVLNKIRSLWSIGASAAGLNQLAGRTSSLACVVVCMSCCCRDDEGGSIRPVGHTKKSSQSDLYMRLGLLLGDNARRASRSAALSPPPRRPGSSTNHSHGSCASFSSLASLEATTLTSTNTSPVSTLTEQQICAHTTHPGIKLLSRALIGMLCACVDSRIFGGRRTQPCQNPEGSFLRQYHVLDVSLWSKQLLVKPRQSETLRHKLDKDTILSSLSLRLCSSASQPGRVEELNIFKNRRTSIRRSARTGSVKGPIDPKVALSASHSLLMSSDRTRPDSRDWTVMIGYLQEAATTPLSSGSSVTCELFVLVPCSTYDNIWRVIGA
uniref:Uncharacterized protein n=1 Tax=Timema bartmani TaxID=61472 RepID=A0A7R9F0F1_9NEOP|nr:unnamed protein product [Timema bartmani]